jgi:hypothetical protein
VIGSALAWWAVSSILGLAVLPIVQRLFSRLPDRGYGFSRAIGIMAVGYLLWMGRDWKVAAVTSTLDPRHGTALLGGIWPVDFYPL